MGGKFPREGLCPGRLMAAGHPGRCPGPPTLRVGVLRERCSLVEPKRVLTLVILVK